jgi:hypothetical protein
VPQPANKERFQRIFRTNKRRLQTASLLAFTKNGTAGEVIFAEANPSATQLAERAPKREFVLISDFASSIAFGDERSGL